MGCTPSKSVMTYTQERVCRDLDTCSTFVPSLKSSVSTPERPSRPSPRLCVETSSGKRTFLSIPSHDSFGRSMSNPSSPDAWSTFSTATTVSPHCLPQAGTIKPSSSSNDNGSDSDSTETFCDEGLGVRN